jgi:hypothetical protein
MSCKIDVWQLNCHLHWRLTLHFKILNTQAMQIHKLLISLHLTVTKAEAINLCWSEFILMECTTMYFGMEGHSSNLKTAAAGSSRTVVPTYWTTHHYRTLTNSWRRDHLQKLIAPQLVNKFPTSAPVVGAPLRGALSVSSRPFLMAIIHWQTVSYEGACVLKPSVIDL